MAHGASPASRMGNKLDPYKTAVTLDVLTDYVDFQAYNVWIPGPAMVDNRSSATTVAAILAGVQQHVVRTYPAGKDNACLYEFRRPRHWINGRIRARVWWTGVDPGGNTHPMAFVVAKTTEGELPTSSGAGALVNLGDFNGTDYLLGIIRDFDVGEGVSVSQNDHLITVYFQVIPTILGAGTYLQDFHLIGLEVYYTESKSETSYKLRDEYKNVVRP